MLDGAGRIVACRDPEVPAPRFHLLRTPEGNRWLFHAALGEEQRARLEAVLRAEPVVADCAAMESRPPDLDALRAVLAAYAPLGRQYRGPAFAFPDALPADPPIAAEVLADHRREPHLGTFGWLREAGDQARPVAVVRAEDGTVAAVCHSSRLADRAAEAGVETAPAYRRRGYGAATVITWVAEVRQTGRVPLYGTTWDNTASRALARRLGLVAYGEDVHLG